MVRLHLVVRRVIVVVGVVLIAHGVIVLVGAVVVMRVVVVMPMVAAARVVLVAAVVQHKLVDESTGVRWRIDFIPQRYISCGLCARRTPPQGSARRDCPPFRSWCSAARGRCVNWPKLSK